MDRVLHGFRERNPCKELCGERSTSVHASICLTEIKSRYLRDGKDPTTRIDMIMERSFIMQIDGKIALLAADLKQRHKLHTIDAIIHAAAQHKNLTLVTGDQHFKNLPRVEII